MKKKNQIENIKKKAIPVLKENKVKKAGIFGSYARNKSNKRSDIDILVELPERLSLLDVVRIKRALEKRLNKKVDLIEYNLIHPLIKEDALKEEEMIV